MRPLVAALERHVLAADRLHADDRPVPVLAPRTSKTSTGRLWAYLRDDLLWIMAQESVGVPGAHNGGSTASGLFQLLEAQRQAFYPHGDASIGNFIEEAQGGIRYIMDRYGSVAAARRFWDMHHWY